jgi:membrane protease YdiL (CAAX protease family)
MSSELTSPIALAVFAVLGVLGLAVTAWVFWPAFHGREAARVAIGSHAFVAGTVVCLLFMYVLVAVALQPLLSLDKLQTMAGFAAAFAVTDIPLLAFVYLRLVLPGAATWGELGLRPLPVGYVLRMGLGGGLVGLIANFTVVGLLSQFGLQPNQIEQFAFVLTEGPGAFLVLLLMAGVVAPVVEELFFRGFLFGLYRRRQPLWVAYLVSTVLFTVAHLQPDRMNLTQMAGLSIGIMLLAMLLAWLYQRTGSLYPGILAHALNNATGLVLFYAVGVR